MCYDQRCNGCSPILPPLSKTERGRHPSPGFRHSRTLFKPAQRADGTNLTPAELARPQYKALNASERMRSLDDLATKEAELSHLQPVSETGVRYRTPD